MKTSKFGISIDLPLVLALHCPDCGKQIGGCLVGDSAEPDVRRYAAECGLKVSEVHQMPGLSSPCGCEASPALTRFARLIKGDETLMVEHDRRDGMGWRGGWPKDVEP